MSIVISPNIRLVITDSDTTNFDFATNKATEISVLKNITIDNSMLSLSAAPGVVSNTPNRVTKYLNTGRMGTKLKFSTYLKPITDGANTSCAEKLLWESLAATDVTDITETSIISFTTGNTNKLRELFFYIIFEDGTYYKINNAVVAAVTINLDINKIATADWEIIGLSLELLTTALTGTTKLLNDSVFIRNKLSTINLLLDSVSYDIAILKANIAIKNLVTLINRVRVGELLNPTGHYTRDRTTTIEASFYLNTKTDGSSSLLSVLNNYTTLADINKLVNATLSIGGSSNNLRVDVNMPTSKITLKNPTVGLFNTVDVLLVPQESILGAGDEINLIYNN